MTKCDVSRFLIIVKRKIIVSQNRKIQLKWLLAPIIFILSIPESGEKTRTYFTFCSVRRSSEAGKQEVQFRFVELRLSACSCFPKKARVHFRSELRLRFPSPPTSRLFRTPNWKKLSKTRAMSHWMRLINCTNLGKNDDNQFSFTNISLN